MLKEKKNFITEVVGDESPRVGTLTSKMCQRCRERRSDNVPNPTRIECIVDCGRNLRVVGGEGGGGV